MNGKKKCKILKEIRKQIAEQNDIEYITSACQHKGDCKGTCPKCEAEVRYLEKELEKRQKLGRRVAVVGIAAALAVSTAVCVLEREAIQNFFTAGPDFEELLLLEENARNEYISKFSREEIHDAWGKYLNAALNIDDRFFITYNGELYYVDVRYDKDRTHEDRAPVRISIEKEDGTIMGDFALPGEDVPVDGEMLPPFVSVSELLSVSEYERNQYISGFSKNDIRYEWENEDSVLGETEDIFYTEDGDYKIIVRYDENGMAISIEIIFWGTTAGDPIS